MQKINFQNLPNTTTPVNDTNLNLLQDNVEDALMSNLVDLNNEWLNGLFVPGMSWSVLIPINNPQKISPTLNITEASYYGINGWTNISPSDIIVQTYTKTFVILCILDNTITTSNNVSALISLKGTITC